MNTHIENSGPEICRHDHVELNLHYDFCEEAGLNGWEKGLQRIAVARTAIETALQAHLGGCDIPHSRAIDQMIATLPVQDKISLIYRNLGFASKYEELIAEPRAALEACSAALAAADHFVGQLLRRPSRANPSEIYAVARGLETALENLEAAYAN
jgi:hypothetical protein